MYYSCEFGGENGGKKGQGGVEPAVKSSMTHAARPPKFIRDRLLKVTFELRGRAKVVTFIVAYAPTGTITLVIKMHSGLPWTELWRSHLNTNSCSS